MQEATVFLTQYELGILMSALIFVYWLIGFSFYLGLTKELDNLCQNFQAIRYDALDSEYKEMYENLARKNERLDWNPPCIVTLAFRWVKDVQRLRLLKQYFKTQPLFVSERETP